MKPKIIMNKTEEIAITKHILGNFDCALVYEKRNNGDAPVLIGIMELMLDISGNDEQAYVLINDVDGCVRGIYPCDYCIEYWEDFMEEYFADPNEYYYVYKQGEDYTVNEEYNFK